MCEFSARSQEGLDDRSGTFGRQPGWPSAKRFLSPAQKHESWVRLVRGGYSTADAADRGVARSTIMRVQEVAKDPLAASKPGSGRAVRIGSWRRLERRSPYPRRR